MPAKKKPATKPTPTPRKASKPARKAATAVPPKILGLGSVPLYGAGRIRWSCEEAKDGVVIRFEPAGTRKGLRRVSLDMKFDSPPASTSHGKLDGNTVSYQFIPQEDWPAPFVVSVEGVDHAPEVR